MMQQHDLVSLKREPTGSSRRQKIFACFKEKKEWVKLNSSFLIGASVSSASMHVASQVAENHGVDRMVATTLVAGVTGYVIGTLATCVSWLAFNQKEYSGKIAKVVDDIGNLLKSTLIAQTVTWGVSWLATGLVLYADASNFLATLTQQVFGIVYLPIFNYLNRQMISEMHAERVESTDFLSQE